MTFRLAAALLAALLLSPTLALAARPWKYAGVVHAPDGHPVAGADLFLLESYAVRRMPGCDANNWSTSALQSPDISPGFFCNCLQVAQEPTRVQLTTRAGKSNDEGRFEVGLRSSGNRLNSRTVFAEANGLVGATDGHGQNPLVIELAAPKPYSGTVVDVDGRPIAGATVVPVPVIPGRPAGTSAADGSFEVETLPQAFDGLFITAPGFLPVFLKPGTPLIMLRSVTLAGAVVSAGKPVPGARLTVHPACFEPIALNADATGHFQVPGIPPLRTAVEAQSGRELAKVVVASPRAGEPVMLELTAGNSIVGTVLDADGKPVAGAAVRAFGDDLREHKATTDASGNYVIAPVGDGGFWVGMEKLVGNKGYVTLKPTARSARHDIRLVAFEPTYAGTVVGTDGAPVAGASVSMDFDKHSLELERPPEACTTSTDARGRFVCHELARGKNRVRIEGKGLTSTSQIVDVPGQGPQRFVVMRAR